jgi:hypothetical protein
MTSIPLREWLQAATPATRKALARAAKVSIQTLGHIAYGHRRGSALTAIRITKAEPGISQTSICPACRECPHYRAAKA